MKKITIKLIIDPDKLQDVANLADSYLGIMRDGGDSHEDQDALIEVIDDLIDQCLLAKKKG